MGAGVGCAGSPVAFAVVAGSRGVCAERDCTVSSLKTESSGLRAKSFFLCFLFNQDFTAETVCKKNSDSVATPLPRSTNQSGHSLPGRPTHIRPHTQGSIPGPTNETSQKLEAEAAGLDEKIRALEALNTANDDVEDVTPAAPKVKPVMMKLFPEYNLILQEIHRTHPLRPPIHISVDILRSKRNLPTTTEKLPNSSLTRDASTMLLTPLQTDHSSWSSKAFWPPPSPKKLKKILLIKVSKLKKSRSCANLKQKVPSHLHDRDNRDENVDDIFKIRSCLYMQVKFDPFRKNSRPTQCYNCNFFHHASQNCSMKTRCLKCGGGHRTGQCEIKEK
ncbi:hypothetical protein TNCV_2834771 [Trichonephila clavipes]|nr:hypothetical protein TNCV_2834771 [Trichonephila clavipes]